jgi:hypothetical protein
VRGINRFRITPLPERRRAARPSSVARPWQVTAESYRLKQPTGDGPFAMFENTVNPHDPHHLELYWDLARQTHWHAFVLGKGNRELNWFEFENQYELDATLKSVTEMTRVPKT